MGKMNAHHEEFPNMSALMAGAVGVHDEFLKRRAEQSAVADAYQRDLDKLFVSGVFGALTSKSALPVWMIFGAGVLAACGTGMGAQNPDNAVTPFPAVEATPTLSIHASPDQIGFPSDVDWIKPANVYDNAHVAVQADKVAMAVEAAIAQDGGGIASDCEWWEAYDDVSGSDTDWNAGLICSFNMPFQGNHYQLLALSEDNDGNPTYLGRGDGIRYYQLLDDSSRPGFVQMIEVGNPNDQLRDIFQVDKTGNIIAFLPLGETEWSIGTFGGGKVQAAPAQVSVWASIFAEPTAGAEVTVNGEAGTIEVGGQVINTPAETKPAPTATPEPLLPPDFTVANWKEFRTKILPYCFVQPGLTDDIPGVDKVKEMLQGSEILEKLDERVGVNMFGYGTSVVSADGGGCAIISIWSDANTKSGALFQSKFDQTWIEITFVKN